RRRHPDLRSAELPTRPEDERSACGSRRTRFDRPRLRVQNPSRSTFEGRHRMKVTELSITLHRWDVPLPTYSHTFGGEKQVGVVTIKTDEGIEGNSFLGN